MRPQNFLFFFIISFVLVLLFFTGVNNFTGLAVARNIFSYFILFSIVTIYLSYVVYEKKVKIKEVEKEAERYRKKLGVSLEVKEKEKILSPEDITTYESRRVEGIYFPPDKIIMREQFPHPLPPYQSPLLRQLREKYPEYWDSLKSLLLLAIENPYIQNENLMSKFKELEEKMREKLYKVMDFNDSFEDLLSSLPSTNRESLTLEESKKRVREILQRMDNLSSYLPENLRNLHSQIKDAVYSILSQYQEGKRGRELEPYHDALAYLFVEITKEKEEMEKSMYYLDRHILHFLNAPPQDKMKAITQHLFAEFHELNHADVHRRLLKKESRLYFSKAFVSLLEGLGNAFALYKIAQYVERGKLPFDILLLALNEERASHEYVIRCLKEGRIKKPINEFSPYVVGDKILGLDKLWERLWKRISYVTPERLSKKEMDKEIQKIAREIREEIERKMEYFDKIIESDIPDEEKEKKLREMEYAAIIELYREASSRR
jgi:hypothetical protein